VTEPEPDPLLLEEWSARIDAAFTPGPWRPPAPPPGPMDVLADIRAARQLLDDIERRESTPVVVICGHEAAAALREELDRRGGRVEGRPVEVRFSSLVPPGKAYVYDPLDAPRFEPAPIAARVLRCVLCGSTPSDPTDLGLLRYVVDDGLCLPCSLVMRRE
jgi:hypothetical protein